MLEEYNQEGDFAVKLQFEGIEYSKDVFSRCVSDKASCSFQIPVIHTIVAKGSYLLLTTIGDIFEYEIVRDIEQCCLGECHTKTATKATRETGAQEFCPNRLFRDEAYIPELLKSYDPSTMHASLEDNIVIVTYRKLVH